MVHWFPTFPAVYRFIDIFHKPGAAILFTQYNKYFYVYVSLILGGEACINTYIYVYNTYINRKYYLYKKLFRNQIRHFFDCVFFSLRVLINNCQGNKKFPNIKNYY